MHVLQVHTAWLAKLKLRKLSPELMYRWRWEPPRRRRGQPAGGDREAARAYVDHTFWRLPNNAMQRWRRENFYNVMMTRHETFDDVIMHDVRT
jgi:hypothetical protein